MSLDGSCMVSPSLGPPVTITDQQLLHNDLTLPLKHHAFPSLALTKTRVWMVTFALCPGEEAHESPLTTEWNLHFQCFKCTCSLTSLLLFSMYKAANKAISIALPCLFYLMYFWGRSLRGHGMLFTLISCYLSAQLRLMLQVIALLLHSTALDGGKRWSGKKQPRRVKHRVTWGSRWSPWHVLGGQCNRQSNSVMKRSDGTQPFSVLIPSTSTPFTPAVDQERLDLAIRCQTCSASCSGPDGRDMQDTKRHCDKRYTLQEEHDYHQGTHGKGPPISSHLTKKKNCKCIYRCI